MWCSVLSLGVVLAAPRVVRGLLTGAAFAGVAGVRVAALYAPLASDDDRSSTQSTIVGDIKMGTGRVGRPRRNWVYTAASLLSSFALWSIPGIGLNLGQRASNAEFHDYEYKPNPLHFQCSWLWHTVLSPWSPSFAMRRSCRVPTAQVCLLCGDFYSYLLNISKVLWHSRSCPRSSSSP
jgi:hypothetical protein